MSYVIRHIDGFYIRKSKSGIFNIADVNLATEFNDVASANTLIQARYKKNTRNNYTVVSKEKELNKLKRGYICKFGTSYIKYTETNKRVLIEDVADATIISPILGTKIIQKQLTTYTNLNVVPVANIMEVKKTMTRERSFIIRNNQVFVTNSKIYFTTALTNAKKFSYEDAVQFLQSHNQTLSGFKVYEIDPSGEINNAFKRILFSKSLRELIYKKSKQRCFFCGEKIKLSDITIDHYIPLSKGGSNSEENLVCACKECNILKGCMMPEVFLERVRAIAAYDQYKTQQTQYQ